MRAVWVLLLLLVGCIRLADEPDNWSCHAHADCPSDMHCLGAYSWTGLCTKENVCSQNADCRGELYCIDRTCQLAECSGHDDPACGAYACDTSDGSCFTTCDAYDDHCQEDHYCDSSKHCVPNCQADEECGAGLVCSEGKCQGLPCTSDESCGDFVCGYDGRCVTYCTLSIDCRDDLRCADDGTCKSCSETCAPYACTDRTCNKACATDADCAAGYDCARDGRVRRTRRL